MDEERITKGVTLAEQVWWSLAKKIVFLAGTHYKWDEEQWREANDKFLRPNDYKVIIKP